MAATVRWLFIPVPYRPGMVDDRAQLEKWIDAESAYRVAVKAFLKAHHARTASRSDALVLASLRAKADKHRARYFGALLTHPSAKG